MKKTLLLLLLPTIIGGCASRIDDVLPDGRKIDVRTYTDPMMTSRHVWAESEPGSGEYAPVAHMAAPGPLPSLGPALLQGPLAWLLGISGSTNQVFVTATGGSGGDATATSQ